MDWMRVGEELREGYRRGRGEESRGEQLGEGMGEVRRIGKGE